MGDGCEGYHQGCDSEYAKHFSDLGKTWCVCCFEAWQRDQIRERDARIASVLEFLEQEDARPLATGEPAESIEIGRMQVCDEVAALLYAKETTPATAERRAPPPWDYDRDGPRWILEIAGKPAVAGSKHDVLRVTGTGEQLREEMVQLDRNARVAGAAHWALEGMRKVFKHLDLASMSADTPAGRAVADYLERRFREECTPVWEEMER